MSFINRFSYLIISLALVTLGAIFAVLLPSDLIGTLAFLFGALALVYWVAARRGPRTPVNPAKRIRRARTGERPVVVCLYHDWNAGCLLHRPFTAKVEREFKGRCDIIYIDAYHHDAAPVLAEFGAEVGDWLLFDAAGNLVEKTGSLTMAKLEQLVQRPL